MTTSQLTSPSADTAGLEAFCCSGNSPTLHLIGAGVVGSALLELLPALPARLVALSDSTATVHARAGLPCRELAAFKRRGGSLADRPGAEVLPLPLALDVVDADIVIDATPTDVGRAGPAVARCRGVLDRGQALVLAAKDALAAAPGELLAHRERLGIHAVLGGTGASLRDQLDELQPRTQSVAAVANATTTALIEELEKGSTVPQALQRARDLGLLEHDASIDLDGTDAWTKLAIVAGALWGATPALHHPVQLDPAVVRRRAEAGSTTRLVARASRAGAFEVRYEELPRTSPLAVPCDRVAYAYELDGGDRRIHIGSGLGPDGTAGALLHDLQQLVAAGGAQ